MSPSAAIEMQPIGVVHCDVADDDVARRRRELVSEVEIFPEFGPGLHRIEEYSHLFILFWMHRAVRTPDLTWHPRGDRTIEATGVLAARGRNHPNPIGLAVVELLAVEGCRLTVRRLDAFDGTPVLDVKPYDDYDIVSEPRVPQWLRRRALSRR